MTSVTAFFILQSTVSGSWPASALASALALGTCSRLCEDDLSTSPLYCVVTSLAPSRWRPVRCAASHSAWVRSLHLFTPRV